MKEIIISLASGGVAYKVLEYLFKRYFRTKTQIKEEEAKALGSELDNVEKAVNIWRQLNEELVKKVEVLEQKIQDIEVFYQNKCANCKYKKEFYKSLQEPNPEKQ